jgi:ABC-type amino acid transport substrate-binding protein/beta-galactosidase beta subunit
MKQLYFFIFIFQTLLFAATPLLTTQEEIWLQEHKNITVGIDPNFMPFEFVDEQGKIQGFSIDYFKEIEKLLHVKFSFIQTSPWNELISMVKAKQIDMLSCIVKTSQREAYLNFTTPYISIPMVIVTNKATGFINGLKDLEDTTVAVIKGYTPEELLSKYYPKIHLVRTKDLDESLELVSSGKTFAHVGNLSRIVELLQERGFQNLAISGITEYKYDFSAGIKKENLILVSIMQKAFNAIPHDVKQKIYEKWFPINYKQARDYKPFIIIAIVAFIVLTFILLWMYKLKKEIKRRILVEEQLEKNVHWLSKSLQKADIGAWEWDLKTNIVTGNSVYAKILGFDKDKISLSAKELHRQYILKEDLHILLNELENYFNKEAKTCSAQFRIKTRFGEVKKIHSSGETFKYDAFNNPEIMFGFIKEIKED